MLDVSQLTVRYGALTALREVDLTVGDGETVALLGANGAGKSTLVSAVCGLVPVATGAITFDGSRIDGLPPSQIIARGIAVVPEGRQVFPDLTVEQNLRLGAYGRLGGLLGALGRWRRARIEVAADLKRVYAVLPQLLDLRTRSAGLLSGGEQQMVAVGRALMARPRLLLVDELSLGLANQVTRALAEHLMAINATGVAILIIEQNAELALELATRAYLLEAGALVTDAAGEVRERGAVLRAYLGLEERKGNGERDRAVRGERPVQR